MIEWRRFWIGVMLSLLAALFGGVLGWTLNDLSRPNCPTEDSCAVDYRDGAWHIEESK
jgi:hypothetical protein